MIRPRAKGANDPSSQKKVFHDSESIAKRLPEDQPDAHDVRAPATDSDRRAGAEEDGARMRVRDGEGEGVGRVVLRQFGQA